MFSKAVNKAPAIANGKTPCFQIISNPSSSLTLGLSKSFQRQVFRTPMMMSSVPMRMYGNLSDQDRIFTNLYNDQSPWLDGALKRGDWH